MQDNEKYNYDYMARWTTRAKCHEEGNPDWFYEEDDLEFITEVKNKFCGVCPVKTHCLWTAINENDKHGIWGGLIPTERAKFVALLDKGCSEEYALMHIQEKWREKVERKARKDQKNASAVNARNNDPSKV